MLNTIRITHMFLRKLYESLIKEVVGDVSYSLLGVSKMCSHVVIHCLQELALEEAVFPKIKAPKNARTLSILNIIKYSQ